MRVTRLEIFGFKSFLEKLALPLEVGFTGVVGPNGCGKSNIVDAIRWILGETRASQLRGGSLEDVIFNGTDKLRPLGLAEVTLTLRSAERDFFSEIVATLTRQGNQFASLLATESGAAPEDEMEQGADLDAADLEAAESGRPHLTVISGAKDGAETGEASSAPLTVLAGGGVESSSAAGAESEVSQSAELGTPVDLESLPLEVAHADDVADEEYARHALNRFGWLRSVQEVQITRRLYRSGESEFFINRVPCRLKDIKELFRLAGLGARAYTIVAQGEVGRIVTSRPEERRLIIEEAAGVAGFREKIAAAGRRLEETNANLTRLDDVTREVQRQVNSLRVQASRAKARQQLKDRVVELERALFSDQIFGILDAKGTREKALEQARAEEAAAEACFEKARATEGEARGAVLTIDVEGDDIRRRIDAITDELRQRSERRSHCVAKVSETAAQLDAGRAQLLALQDRRQTLVDRRSEIERSIGELESKDAGLVQQLGETGGNYDEIVRQLSQSLASLREQLNAREHAFRSTRDKLVSAESRLSTIVEQIEATSPVAQMRDVIAEGKHASLFSTGLPSDGSSEGAAAGDAFRSIVERLSAEAKLFVSGLKVAPEFVRALQAALGEKVSYLVTADVAGSARGYSAAVRNLALVERQGSRRFEPPALGLILSGDSSKIPSALNITVPFPRLLDQIEIAEECRTAAQELFAQVYVAPTVDAAVDFLSAHADELRTVPALTIVTSQGEVLTPTSYFCAGRTDRGVLHLQQDAESLRLQIAEFKAEYETLVRVREELQGQISEADRQHGEALAESRRQQARARELSNQQGAVRGRLQAEKRVLVQIEQDIGRVDQSIGEAQARIDHCDQSLAARRIELEDLERALNAAGEAQDLSAELQTLRGQWQQVEARRSATRDVLGKLAQQLELARNDRERARSAVSRAELEVEKAALELQSLQQRVESEYGADFYAELAGVIRQPSEGPVSAALAPEVRAEYQDEVQKIRARIAREGEVDSSSIARFDEEQSRLEDLTAQREDLSSAARTLERTIEKLRETSEIRFISTFKAVRTNFSKLIPRLFGGGRGSLELTDPAKPLECGIEITVRPPGKKLKSIELMSGGEKALCAIALIVAMFMERPSPLCVLDEVDAPLDEANLVRFLSLLKDMSNRTQFVVVTHNKQTMTVADQLVGVTMQQPGASTVVTVSLQEAYQHVA